MVRLICAVCGRRVGANDVICRAGHSLLGPDKTVEVSAPAPAPVTGTVEASGSRPEGVEGEAAPPAEVASAGPPAPRVCRHCGASVGDAADLCPQCLGELGPAAPSAPATIRDVASPRLELAFPFRTFAVPAGEELSLGRDVPGARARELDAYDNVSRVHATVGLTPEGAAWVRDEGSTNGTYVDGRKVPCGVVVALPDGAELRLASNVRAHVRVAPGGGDR